MIDIERRGKIMLLKNEIKVLEKVLGGEDMSGFIRGFIDNRKRVIRELEKE